MIVDKFGDKVDAVDAERSCAADARDRLISLD